jgi:hypothetical protein
MTPPAIGPAITTTSVGINATMNLLLLPDVILLEGCPVGKQLGCSEGFLLGAKKVGNPVGLPDGNLFGE